MAKWIWNGIRLKKYKIIKYEEGEYQNVHFICAYGWRG
jgi:hypothetical protein